ALQEINHEISLELAQEEIPPKKSSLPRDAKGRFIKKVVAVMVNAQKWLDKKYPNKDKIEKINGDRELLTGKLIIADFPQKKHFPEMDLIDISDLDDLAARVDKKTACDKEFLKQICPLEPEKFIKQKKGNFY
ncbi:2816_t:CDS:2, partial [Racocetra fulgida]